jgi:hypothetical protein
MCWADERDAARRVGAKARFGLITASDRAALSFTLKVYFCSASQCESAACNLFVSWAPPLTSPSLSSRGDSAPPKEVPPDLSQCANGMFGTVHARRLGSICRGRRDSFRHRCRSWAVRLVVWRINAARRGAYNDALPCESASRDMSAQITTHCGALR